MLVWRIFFVTSKRCTNVRVFLFRWWKRHPSCTCQVNRTTHCTKRLHFWPTHRRLRWWGLVCIIEISTIVLCSCFNLNAANDSRLNDTRLHTFLPLFFAWSGVGITILYALMMLLCWAFKLVFWIFPCRHKHDAQEREVGAFVEGCWSSEICHYVGVMVLKWSSR
jgi:hypothetical protein